MDQQTRFFVLLAALGLLIVVLLWARWRENRQSATTAEENKVVSINSRRRPAPESTGQRHGNADDDLAGSYGASYASGVPVGRHAAGAMLGTLAHDAVVPDERCEPDGSGREEPSDSSDACVPETGGQTVDTGGQTTIDTGGYTSSSSDSSGTF